MFCKQCGCKLPSGAEKCPECGEFNPVTEYCGGFWGLFDGAAGSGQPGSAGANGNAAVPAPGPAYENQTAEPESGKRRWKGIGTEQKPDNMTARNGVPEPAPGGKRPGLPEQTWKMRFYIAAGAALVLGVTAIICGVILGRNVRKTDLIREENSRLLVEQEQMKGDTEDLRKQLEESEKQLKQNKTEESSSPEKESITKESITEEVKPEEESSLPEVTPEGEGSLPEEKPEGESDLPEITPEGEGSWPEVLPEGESTQQEGIPDGKDSSQEGEESSTEENPEQESKESSEDTESEKVTRKVPDKGSRKGS